MKKIRLLFLFLLLFRVVSYAQETQKVLADYIANFQYQKALDYIEKQDPTKELLLKKVLCYKALGDFKRAMSILEPLSEEYPTNLQIKSELAFCSEALGQWQKSLGYYTDLIRLDSTNAYFKKQKADILYQCEKYNEALDMYQTVYREYGFVNSLKRSAQCFEKINQADSAKLYYAMAWEVDSTDNYSAASLINLNLKTEHYGNAMLLSDIYLKKDSTNKQINLLNALSYYSADLYEEAISRFSKCYADGDSSLIVNRSLGIAYYSLKDSYGAQPHLEAALRQDSTNNNVLYCLAVVCNDLAEHKKAIPYFKKLLDRTIPPDFTLYLYYKGLATAYDKGSDFQASIDTYLKALNYAGPNQKMSTYYTISNLYDTRLKDVEKAMDYYKLYRGSLVSYLDELKKKEAPDLDEIKDVESRIKYLDEHLKKMR